MVRGKTELVFVKDQYRHVQIDRTYLKNVCFEIINKN